MPLLLAVVYLLLLVLAAVRYVRWRRVTQTDGTFRCRVRRSSGRCAQWPRLRRRWARRRWACWVGDDLVIWRRQVLLTSVRLRGQLRRDGVYRLTDSEVKGCGYRPLAIELDLADGSRIEVVTVEWARAELVGPYLAAALIDLPRAPRSRRQIRGPGF